MTLAQLTERMIGYEEHIESLEAEAVLLRQVEHRARSIITREDLDYAVRFDFQATFDRLDRHRGVPPVHEIPRDRRAMHAR